MLDYDADTITPEQFREVIDNINTRQYDFDEIYYIARLLYMIIVKKKVPPMEVN